ncbi:MAG: serine/threonine protein kinase [Bacteriovoracaceae bacterium]
MSEKKFERFGKYLILDHLVDGGMAKICRSRYLGDQANKIVAIKMVQPQFSNDASFVKMFQDELNITFGMLHPNVMQVYDYGKTNGQLYTAMEYIHGANLKQYLDRLKERKVVFPVEITTFIISQVCQGLYYAHTFTDKLTGKPFNIIHRDISPHNIMLTYDGAVKVIDFGIAKADTNSEATQAGTIKGKLSYLAPEYLEGLDLDQRYDIFAVGITMWEMLCSRKLFQAANDLAVLKQIQTCKITPPSQVNPNVPKELDAIVMKALAKDRSARYENMDQFNRALVKFLYSQYPDFNSSDLAFFAKELFGEEIQKDGAKFVDYGSIDITPYIEDMKREESKTGKIARKDVKEAIQKDQVQKMQVLELSMEDVTGIELATSALEATAQKKVAARATSSGPKPAKSIANKTGSVSVSRRDVKDRSGSSRVTSKRDLKNTKQESSSSSGSIIILIIAASLTGFAYLQPDFVEEMTGLNLYHMIHGEPSRQVSSVGQAKPERVENAPQGTPKEKVGRIILSGVDMTMDVTINGQKKDYIGSSIEVPLNREMTVTIKKQGYASFVKRVITTPEQSSVVVEVPALDRARIGLLTTSLNYSAGSKLVFEVDGEMLEKQMPFSDLQIPEGSYSAKVVNPILGTEKKVEFRIEENKKQFLD